MSKRVAIYARVSTRDRNQDPENQLRELREWCRASGYEVFKEYIEHESGRKSVTDRPVLNQLFEDGSKKKFDLVLVWALDRFSRAGMTDTVMQLERLGNMGLYFHSYTEPLISTENPLVRDILIAVYASLAQQEAVRMSERVKAGLEKAKDNGVKLGRPSKSDVVADRVRELAQTDMSIRKIAYEVEMPASTIAPLVKEVRSRG